MACHPPIAALRPSSALIHGTSPPHTATRQPDIRPIGHKLNEATLQIIDVQHSCNGKVVLA